MNFSQLDHLQQDTLCELSNIGMGQAATALSQMVGRTIMVHVPSVTTADIAEVPDLLGGPERLVAGVILRLEGTACGNMLLVLPEASAEQLLQVLLGPDGSLESELGVSTLQEIGNILASSYLNALGNMLGMPLYPSIPQLAYDMAGAVVDQVLGEIGASSDLALVLETEFAGNDGPGEPIRGHFFLLPDAETLEIILAAAGGAA
ncbi:CheY-P-specific phosphatase CheC [Geothermobacter hydrogeniphilus]|uniref:CheY-P-specific phosphatase CheC n=1 Tax=Geothermobacter hydrogeniphilus TaxID=1969733 RepID=A0A2K2HET3_9BACT|nr:chemotaxis protein CheC [Geothermobacter hydrogeniphilus]PNU21805.1 CheY-P-specific phosphatase CheC [Geothermobacter hydrogeniphilus]